MTDQIVKIGDDFQYVNPSVSYSEIKVITEGFKSHTNFCTDQDEGLIEDKKKIYRSDGQNILDRCSIQLGLVMN